MKLSNVVFGIWTTFFLVVGALALTISASANGAESVVLWQGSAILHAAADIANLESRCVLDVDWRDPQVKGPIIAAGTSGGLALKLLTACAVSTVVTNIEFTEAFWV